MKKQEPSATGRRDFIATVVSGAAAFGISSAIAPFSMHAGNTPAATVAADAEKWFQQVKGKHKMVFDWPKHNNGAALGWALTLMDTYNDMGTPDKELSIVLILRYATTPLSIGDTLWTKYGFGKRIDLKDPDTNEFAMRNIFAKCPTEDDDCIELFQKRGGLVCVCNHALQSSAESLAEQLKLNKEEVRKEFMDNLLPGIQPVPSGIWALNRAQELGCTFSFGG